MSSVKVNPELIHLEGIKILKAHFEVDEELMDAESGMESFKVDLGSSPGFDLENKMVRLRLTINIKGVDGDEKEIGVRGSYCIDFIYMIENLDEYVSWEKSGEAFGVDENLAATISGISYSTARGIILDRTQVTEFKGIILPVIDPYQLLDKAGK
ncbi:MAG: hypothetical protein ACI9Z3_000997 [Roseivirga sp.]|jgi:hypothetical protein